MFLIATHFCIIHCLISEEDRPKNIQLRKKSDVTIDFEKKYRPNNPTKIVIHGWKSSISSDLVNSITYAYLSTLDCNVIGNFYRIQMYLEN